MSDVRAITVKQPWAWAIAAGHKLIENRSRGTSYRGTLFIHAGKAWSERGAVDERVLAARASIGVPQWTFPSSWLPPGAVIAVAELVDSHPDAGCCRPWGESAYIEGGGVRTDIHHLVLEDVVPLAAPVPCRGALGLWRPPVDVALAAVLTASGAA